MHDHTRSQKPDTRNDALDDPACVRIRVLRDGQYRCSRCQGNEAEGSYSNRFLMPLEMYSDYGSDQHRDTKSENYLRPTKHAANPQAEVYTLSVGSASRRFGGLLSDLGHFRHFDDLANILPRAGIGMRFRSRPTALARTGWTRSRSFCLRSGSGH
jgi:hypothetical protein